MTSHLPIQLRDGTAAFVSRLYPIAGHDELACDSIQFVVRTSRQENPQPADSVRRSEQKRQREGSRRMALSDPKMFARPEYLPLWNSESRHPGRCKNIRFLVQMGQQPLVTTAE